MKVKTRTRYIESGTFGYPYSLSGAWPSGYYYYHVINGKYGPLVGPFKSRYLARKAGEATEWQ